MRSLPFTGRAFDGATSLFTSIGYSTEPDDRRTIAEAYRVVRPGGFFVLECASLDEAVEHAAKIPGAEHGSVEVRPVYVDPAEVQL